MLFGEPKRGSDEEARQEHIRFADVFPDTHIVYAVRGHLSWTHFRELLAIDDPLKRESAWHGSSWSARGIAEARGTTGTPDAPSQPGARQKRKVARAASLTTSQRPLSRLQTKGHITMLPWQRRFFYPRSKVPAHTGSIAAHYPGTHADEVFRRLCSRVITHHMIVQPYSSPPQWPTDYGKDDLPPRDCITHLFHTAYYIAARLFLGVDGGSVGLDRFVATITRDTEGELRNNTRFLIGGVGSGKSAFVSNLLVTQGHKWIQCDNIIPLRVDLDLKTEHRLPTKSEVLFAIFDQLRKTYCDLGGLNEVTLEKTYRDAAFDRTDETYKCERALTRLVSGLRQTTRKRPLIIIDNVDFLYHFYDRGLFAREAAAGSPLTPEQQSFIIHRNRAHDVIQYLVRAFIDETALGRLGANVLLVLRQDSLEHYFRTTRIDVPVPYDFQTHTYRLEPPALSDIAAAYLKLLACVISKLPDSARNRTFAEAAEKLLPDAQAPNVRKKAYRDLRTLSRQGLRHVVNHSSRFAWLPITIRQEADKYAIVTRFQEQYTPPLFAFILNGWKLFNQFHAEFPNMYLVRSDIPEDRDSPWASLLHRPHRHTYWLKRLLLAFIAQRERQGASVDPQTIYDVFTDAADPACYEDSIVRLCLGSMSHVESSHLLDFHFAPSVNDRASYTVERVQLTSRGRRLAKGFIDSFTYLQLIVDDDLLPIPRCLGAWFRYDGVDYGYLVDPPGAYGHRVIQMLRKKISQVFCFIETLRVALEFEQKVFATSFRRLQDEDVRLPSVDAIERRCIRELEIVSPYVGGLDYAEFIPDREVIRARLQEEFSGLYLGSPRK